MNRLTLKSFLSRAREAHGNYYDYAQATLVDSKTKIRIGCPTHGFFDQVPGSHMKGHGCKACSVERTAEKRRLTIDQFLARSRATHGDKYDYSKVSYQRNDEEVEILCPVHGAFHQTPNGHMSGKGCLRCAAAKRGDYYRSAAADSFIERARAVHGDKYDYSATVYRTSTTDIEIKCPKHGPFRQTPNNHLRGKGCRKCSVAARSEVSRKDLDAYLSEITVIHGDAFDYSLVNYRGAYSPVTLICVEHGPITKPAREWLSYGCNQCSVARRAGKRRLTTAAFISLARKKHGERYSYDRTQYAGMAKKIIIECHIHGQFQQRAGAHISGSGCRQCAIDNSGSKRRVAQVAFIDRCIAVHEGLYDYSQTVYQTSNQPIEVICPIHGIFSQLALNHVRGHGCPRCAGHGKTTEEFVEEARAIHGDRYDYSLTEFKSVDGKVWITCKVHGPFQQRALGHLNGKGCEGCQRDGWRLSRDEFIERSRSAHGNKYDYSNVIYGKTNRDKVTIVCIDHGPFEQMPVAHMEGHGCRDCYYEARRMTLVEFLDAARERHGGKYDYSKVSYQGINESVQIACPVHEDFWQVASTHLRGSGCPSCNLVGQYSLKALIRGAYKSTARSGTRTLYVAHQVREGEPTFVNVGLAKQGYKKRYSARHPYATEDNPDRLTLPTELAVLLEQVLLRATIRFHYEPVIKFAGGAHECRMLDALPVIEKMIEDFTISPARLAEAPWIEEEARRHGMLHLLEGFRNRIGRLARQGLSPTWSNITKPPA